MTTKELQELLVNLVQGKQIIERGLQNTKLEKSKKILNDLKKDYDAQIERICELVLMVADPKHNEDEIRKRGKEVYDWFKRQREIIRISKTSDSIFGTEAAGYFIRPRGNRKDS